MGQFEEPAALDLIESGTEPEFVATRIARYEPLSNGWVRLYICADRAKGTSRMEFSVCCSLTDLADMAVEARKIVATVHNKRTMLAIGRTDLN